MTSNTVQFSVIIPLYNKGPHVERAILSVLQQDWRPAEIIVIDDASTDGGPEVARRFKEVKVLTRGERGPGGYAARNLGIERACSEWIAFLDADDCWRPDHLATLAAAIARADGHVGCAFTRATLVTDTSARTYPVSKNIATCPSVIDLSGFIAAWLDAESCPIWTGAVAVRRSVLLKAGLFPAGSATRGGDKDLWLRVMALTNAVFAPQITAEFHQNTVNRVTAALDHSVQPVICRTIGSLLQSARSDTRRLLIRLNNMEVVFYARYAAGAGAVFNPAALRTLRGIAPRAKVKIAAYALVGFLLRMLRRSRSRSPRFSSPVALRAEFATAPELRSGAQRHSS